MGNEEGRTVKSEKWTAVEGRGGSEDALVVEKKNQSGKVGVMRGGQ